MTPVFLEVPRQNVHPTPRPGGRGFGTNRRKNRWPSRRPTRKPSASRCRSRSPAIGSSTLDVGLRPIGRWARIRTAALRGTSRPATFSQASASRRPTQNRAGRATPAAVSPSCACHRRSTLSLHRHPGRTSSAEECADPLQRIELLDVDFPFFSTQPTHPLACTCYRCARTLTSLMSEETRRVGGSPVRDRARLARWLSYRCRRPLPSRD